MTKQSLSRYVGVVAAFYGAAMLAIVLLRVYDTTPGARYYGLGKDLTPFILAIPAALLTVCFQRRAAYVSHLRSLWADVIDAVQGALQYTHRGAGDNAGYWMPCPDQQIYGDTLRDLSVVIDKMRGVFKNIGESERQAGLFPFESMKEIYNIVSDLGFGDAFHAEKTAAARKAIWQRWDILRKTLPLEFERDNPTFVETKYLIRSGRVTNVRDAFNAGATTLQIK